MRGLLAATVAAVALALPGAAEATPPTLLTVGQTNRHLSATFAAPGADDATIYFASKPDRATDGSFLQENVKESDFLTTDEIQRDAWTDENQVDPGTYYAMLRATDFDCVGQPSCLDGYSNVLTVTVPKPRQVYRGRVEVLHYSHVAFLTLKVTPLGEKLPYKVCWRLASKRLRCVRGNVEGFSWNSSADDDVTVRLRGMARRTTFVWYVGGRRVAAKTANTAAL